MYSNELVQDVLRNADIVDIISNYLTVIKKGRSFTAICPFHDDSNPSLNISREKQIFKCFVCGTGGNAITFVMKKEGISFEEAVRKVAELSNYHDERLDKEAPKKKQDPSIVPLINCINDLAKYYSFSLTIPEGEVARKYLEERHIPADQIAKYGVGYAPQSGRNTVKFLQSKGHSLKSIEDIGIALVRSDDGTSDHNAGRLIFPLYDPNGQVVGFSARRMTDDGTSKYINSPDGKLFHKGNLLYNYHNVKGTAKRDGYCYLLEGFMDVLALEKASLPNAVALMGTSLSNEQIALLKRLRAEIRLCLDGDGPGQRAMMKILPQLQRANTPFRVVTNPGDLRDPDDILQEDGPEVLKKKMENLVSAYDFMIDFYLNTKKLETQDDKRKVLTYFLPFLMDVQNETDRDNYIVKLSKATGYEPETIYRQIKRDKERKVTNAVESVYQVEKGYETFSIGPTTMKRLEKAEREILYYMLSESKAIAFYQKEIENFYTDSYEKIANFIVEYVSAIEGSEKIDVSDLITKIAQSGIEDADKIEFDVSSIAMENWWPEFDEIELARCKKAIDEEKAKVHDLMMIGKKPEGTSPEEQARYLQKVVSSKQKQIKKK